MYLFQTPPPLLLAIASPRQLLLSSAPTSLLHPQWLPAGATVWIRKVIPRCDRKVLGLRIVGARSGAQSAARSCARRRARNIFHCKSCGFFNIELAFRSPAACFRSPLGGGFRSPPLGAARAPQPTPYDITPLQSAPARTHCAGLCKFATMRVLGQQHLQ